MTCPFHKLLRGLRIFAGLPVPITAKWIDGKPDFRQTDHEQMIRCIRFGLCGVCGGKLKLTCYWIGGPLCQRNRCFADAAMHRECAEESIRLCPFLNGKRQGYRGDLPHVAGQDATARPKRMLLMRGLTAAAEWRLVNGESLIYAGDRLETVGEF